MMAVEGEMRWWVEEKKMEVIDVMRIVVTGFES